MIKKHVGSVVSPPAFKSKTKSFVAALLLAFGACMTAPLSGCDFINTPTKMGQGQLYTSGDGRYDPYFDTVHREQVAAANWGEESRAARKPIVTVLNLKPGVSNGSILAATREKKGDPAVGRAVDETTSAELELARRLNVAAARLEELEKKGEDLKRQAADDKKNAGVAKADETKMKHKDEVRREMSAAVDAVDSMASDAHKYAKEAEELASKLKLVWSDGKDDGTSADKRDDKDDKKKDDKDKDDKKKDDKDKDDKKKDDKKKPEPVAKKPAAKPAGGESPPVATKKPATKPSETEKPPSEPPPAKPQPTQKPPDEVFNP